MHQKVLQNATKSTRSLFDLRQSQLPKNMEQPRSIFLIV